MMRADKTIAERAAQTARARSAAMAAREKVRLEKMTETLRAAGFTVTVPQWERRCPNCDSVKLTWGCTTVNTSGVTDGKLRMSDVAVAFYLGCDECSETVKTYTSDDVVNLLDAVLAGSIASWNPHA